MSFFRFLVGLLIAAGVSFGLYKLTLEKGLGGDTSLGKQSGELSGETVAVRAPVEEPNNASAADGSAGKASEGEAQTFAERTQAAVKTTPDADADGTDAGGTDSATDGGSDMTPSQATDTADASDTMAQAATAAAAAATGAAAAGGSAATMVVGSTDVLGAITDGRNYAAARQAMVEAGWQPRSLDAASRTADIKDSEEALLALGYDELEGCNDAERPICRFEFIDGGDRIAAVITAGADSDPSVIDAFLMDVSAN